VEGAKLILNFVQEHCKGETAIVVGDFNANEKSRAYKILAESGVLNDTYDLAKYRFAPTGTFNGFNPQNHTGERIDHIFVTNDVAVGRYGMLTYHYYRDMVAEQQSMGSAAPKEIKGENRDVKCISDHYAIQSFLTLKGATTEKVKHLVLNVGSFNIRNGKNLKEGSERKGDYKKYNGWDDRKAMLCDMINLEAFDLFGAQEVRKVQLDDMLAMLPDYDYIGVGRDDGGDKGEFSPVFYRKDIFEKLDGGTFWLSPTPDVPSKGWDARYKRICSWGLFRHKASGKKVCFMNVHFDHRGVQARIEASKQIAAYVKKHCKGVPVVLSGDFNVTQHSDSYKTLKNSKVLKDSYNLAKYHFEPTGTFNSFNPKRYTTQRIDHLFVSKGVKVSRWGVLTYHYLRTPTAEEVEASKNEPKKSRYEQRDVKCISDHYAIQSFVTLK
jgi:endonuclease/exonuclease/phosphatase family metal-dependent hydrolase